MASLGLKQQMLLITYARKWGHFSSFSFLLVTAAGTMLNYVYSVLRLLNTCQSGFSGLVRYLLYNCFDRMRPLLRAFFFTIPQLFEV